MSALFLLLQYSRTSVLVAVATAIAGGISNALLLVTVNAAWRGDAAPSVLIAAFVGCGVTMIASRMTTNLLLNHLSTRAVMERRLELLARVMGTPLRQVEQLGPRILTSLTTDAGVIIDAAATLPHVCWNVAVVLACCGYLVWLSPLLFVGVIVVIVVASIAYRAIMRRAADRFRLGRIEWDRVFELLRSSLAGIKELQLSRAGRRSFLDDVARSSAAHRWHSWSSMRLHTMGVSFGHLVFFSMLGLLVFVAPAIATIPSSTVVAYSMLLLYMMNPLDGILSAIPNFARANVTAKRIEELGLTLPPQVDDRPVSPQPQPWTCLQLSDVTYRYDKADDSSDFVLGPVTLTLHPGEVLVVSGGNGSGKSTLARVLTGLYAPASGEIRLNGAPIDPATADYREQFAAVFFDFHLFDRLHGADADRVAAQAPLYLRELQLEGKVTIENGRFSTTHLSQGQRKRLALLVAYLEDRPIYVFDEWAADQDPAFKDVFYRRLLPALRDRHKGVVVISHDDRYFSVADRRIHLENGDIAFEETSGAPAADVKYRQLLGA